MNCTLCGKQIQNYNSMFNHLDIDESHAAEICSECIQKIMKWQQNTYAKLFPAKTIKNIMEKRKMNDKKESIQRH